MPADEAPTAAAYKLSPQTKPTTKMDRSRCQFCGQMVPAIEPGAHRTHKADGVRCEGSHQWVDHGTYVFGDGTPHPVKVAADARGEMFEPLPSGALIAPEGRPRYGR